MRLLAHRGRPCHRRRRLRHHRVNQRWLRCVVQGGAFLMFFLAWLLWLVFCLCLLRAFRFRQVWQLFRPACLHRSHRSRHNHYHTMGNRNRARMSVRRSHYHNRRDLRMDRSRCRCSVVLVRNLDRSRRCVAWWRRVPVHVFLLRYGLALF